jgi:hypothetical protein
MAWGDNDEGQLGDGGGARATTPIAVPGLTGVTAIAAGPGAALALLSDGTVVAWGGNHAGSVGDGTTTEKDVPVPVEGLSEVVGVAAGEEGHSIAVRSDGSVVEWGRSYTSSAINKSPVPVAGISGAVVVAAGPISATALLSDGEVLTWGSPEWGVLGNGETTGAPEGPQRVCAVGSTGPCPAGPFLTGVAQIADGGEFDLARLEDGTVAAWGVNYFGQLGTGEHNGPESCSTAVCSGTPVAVSGLSGVTAVAVGQQHALALLSTGGVDAWGVGGDGQLGNGSENGQDSPMPVSGLSGMVGLAAGGSDSYSFGPQHPVVTKTKPTKGVPGKTVKIEGFNFGTATEVHLGSAAVAFTITSPSKTEATVPELAPGTYGWTVTNPDGTNAPASFTVK